MNQEVENNMEILLADYKGLMVKYKLLKSACVNYLSAINSYVEISKDAKTTASQVQDALDKIENSKKRLEELVFHYDY